MLGPLQGPYWLPCPLEGPCPVCLPPAVPGALCPRPPPLPHTQRFTVGVSLPGGASSPALLQPLAGAVGQLWSQHQRPSATCASWSGFHYQTFDGRHYHFLGHCTYLLAGAADSTWAVHLTPGDHCPQPGHCQLVREGDGAATGRRLDRGGREPRPPFPLCISPRSR